MISGVGGSAIEMNGVNDYITLPPDRGHGIRDHVGGMGQEFELSGPGTAVFVPSSNHATAVDRYVLEVFPVGADPTVANPVATRDLGKPAIANGEMQS